MRRSLLRTLAIALLAGCAGWGVHARPGPSEDTEPFAPIAFMLGSWTGTASGQAGEGSVEREYARVLSGRFVHERNRTSYPPQAANARGEVHEHASYFSYDQARGRIVLRQFHQEGFVNTYVHDPKASGRAKLVFVSEDFENFDDAWKARETYDVISADAFVETFELAAPGKPFETYSRSRMTRARD
jgi:THAP4-like, heme-binding beta-barrel domain